MLRLFVLLLAFVLPVQFAWAGAAAYCQHETEPAMAWHVGHHEHVHPQASAKKADSNVTLDNDCGTCHAGCAQSLPVSGPALPHLIPPHAVVLDAVTQPSSAPPGAPDRPQWPRLA